MLELELELELEHGGTNYPLTAGNSTPPGIYDPRAMGFDPTL